MATVCTEKSKSQVKISVIRAAAAPPTTVGAWSMAVVLWQQYSIINPRRACAERVTVVVLCVCVCVCMYVCHAHAILAVRAIKSVTKDTVVLNVRFAAIL